MKLYRQAYDEDPDGWVVGVSGTKDEIGLFFNLACNYGGVDSTLVWKSESLATFATSKGQMKRFFASYYRARMGGSRGGLSAYVGKCMSAMVPGLPSLSLRKRSA